MYDGRCPCRCGQSSLFVDVVGFLLLMSYSFFILFSFPPMMIIIAVQSGHSHDDPSHVLTRTTPDDDDVQESLSLLLNDNDAGPLLQHFFSKMCLEPLSPRCQQQYLC